jgi:microcin C transport system substrate-binding protein
VFLEIRKPKLLRRVLCLLLLAGAAFPAAPIETTGSHALVLHGAPKYGKDFTHFDYANPNAPKGGFVRRHEIGTFDTLNPFTLKGVAAAGIGNTFDTLTVNSDDEPFTVYGLVAESIEVPADHSWVKYRLRPEARFHDGSPLRAEDVVFSFEILRAKGRPHFRSYYANVAKAEALDSQTVKFAFGDGVNRELPLILGQLPILSKRYWQQRNFDKTTLEAPLGSGPYQVTSVVPGRSVTYRRVKDYWAQDLPVNKGRNNFGTIRFDYYRDATVALEAFKAGEYDFRTENIAKNWAEGYAGPGLDAGLIIKQEIPDERPKGMQAFIFNTRRSVFSDSRVREALSYAYDFEWANKHLFYNTYQRTKSFFSNSELASRGLPNEAELNLLGRYRGQIPEQVFAEPYRPPVTDGSGNIRPNLRKASRLLREAGWVIEGGQRIQRSSGERFHFELLLVSPSFERVALPFKRNLERLGIDMSVRTVDDAQYLKRLENFDFDMIVFTIGQSLSPGNEQRDFWASTMADVPGSRNFAGIKDPVVDQLVELVIAAPDRASLVARTRALDRVLLWGHYVIPQWHVRQFRVAYWDKFEHPATAPKYALGFDTWWISEEKAARLGPRSTRK